VQARPAAHTFIVACDDDDFREVYSISIYLGQRDEIHLNREASTDWPGGSVREVNSHESFGLILG
jgi:hypothetical protein